MPLYTFTFKLLSFSHLFFLPFPRYLASYFSPSINLSILHLSAPTLAYHFLSYPVISLHFFFLFPFPFSLFPFPLICMHPINYSNLHYLLFLSSCFPFSSSSVTNHSFSISFYFILSFSSFWLPEKTTHFIRELIVEVLTKAKFTKPVRAVYLYITHS